MRNTVLQNEEIMNLLAKYRLNTIGNGVMESTGDEKVYKIVTCLGRLMDEFGVTFKDGKFYGLTGAALQDWNATMVSEGKAVTTRNNYTIIFNDFLRWGCGRGLFVDPQTDIPLYKILKCGRMPRQNDEFPDDVNEKFFTEEQIENLIENMPGREKFHVRDRAIVAMFIGSGIRASGLCNMNIGDYKKQEHGRIRIKNKGGAWKLAHLADFAYRFVDAYLETREDKDDMNAPLFVTKYGKRFDRTALYHTMEYRQEQLGMKSGLHIFRHTFTSAAERAGGMAVARDLAIHRSITTTNIYAHTTEKDLHQAINSMPWCKLA